jgi:hypothetical protein
MLFWFLVTPHSSNTDSPAGSFFHTSVGIIRSPSRKAHRYSLATNILHHSPAFTLLPPGRIKISLPLLALNAARGMC